MISNASVYIHIPFCRKKCGYCDFFSCAGPDESLMEQAASSICNEIKSFAAENRNFTASTLYIGGGTPNFLRPDLLKKILDTAVTFLHLSEQAEFSIEANPEFTDSKFLDLIKSSGVNRLSLGVQSFKQQYLDILEREADAPGIRKVLDLVSGYWDGHLSLDLISGLPGQTADDFISDLDLMNEYNPEHLSVYNLSAEPGTMLYKKIENGVFVMPDDNYVAGITESCNAVLSDCGYVHYEVSNYCRDNYLCRHNLSYWHLEPYAGFGPSAVSTLPSVSGPLRISNPRNLDQYLHGQKKTEILSFIDFMKDHLQLQLRLQPQKFPLLNILNYQNPECLSV